MTGDDSIDAFDNARDEIGRKLVLSGILPENLFDLSLATTESGSRAMPASLETLRFALRRLHVGPGDACLLHLTSHGSEEGFQIGDDETLTPEMLNNFLDEGCGAQPSVILVSACYSGIVCGTGDAKAQSHHPHRG